MFFLENAFVYSFLLVAGAVYLLLYAVFKHTDFSQALLLTIIGMVFFP